MGLSARPLPTEHDSDEKIPSGSRTSSIKLAHLQVIYIVHMVLFHGYVNITTLYVKLLACICGSSTNARSADGCAIASSQIYYISVHHVYVIVRVCIYIYI